MKTLNKFKSCEYMVQIIIAATLAVIMAGCMPVIGPPIEDVGWDTNYKDALSPHTQLSLGVMKKLKADENAIPNQAKLASKWEKLAGQIEKGSPDATINQERKELEMILGAKLVNEIKAERYSRGDLMGFMISSGMKIPKGGPGALDPNLIAAQKTAVMLGGGSMAAVAPAAAIARIEYRPVLPEEALSPVETLALGTALLLRTDRDSFDMSQVFRLALYTRPLRRLYDPNPDIQKSAGEEVHGGANIETVYMDRIWRVLQPEQIAKIRAMNLTRTDLDKYIREHVKLYNVEVLEKDYPVFALLEYVVNDFHGQIAPPVTIATKDKADFFIPSSVKKISGLGPDDGRNIYEGACASCHGEDGQGRFPPITMHSYLVLHSDHEHYYIIENGPPQNLGASIVMPSFGDKLTADQIWSVVKYLRSFEAKKEERRGEPEARQAGVTIYTTNDVYSFWKEKDDTKFFLDVQSDIAFRIMGHIEGSVHVRPEELAQKLDMIPRDKEIIVIDMFGSQGLLAAKLLVGSGYNTSYMGPGMIDWHIIRNYPTAYD